MQLIERKYVIEISQTDIKDFNHFLKCIEEIVNDRNAIIKNALENPDSLENIQEEFLNFNLDKFVKNNKFSNWVNLTKVHDLKVVFSGRDF